MITNHIGTNNGNKKTKPVKSPATLNLSLLKMSSILWNARNKMKVWGNHKKKNSEYLAGVTHKPREK